MALRVYRMRQLASVKDRDGLLPMSPATVWRLVRAGKFPKPFKLGANTTVWAADSIDAYLAAHAKVTA